MVRNIGAINRRLDFLRRGKGGQEEAETYSTDLGPEKAEEETMEVAPEEQVQQAIDILRSVKLPKEQEALDSIIAQLEQIIGR